VEACVEAPAFGAIGSEAAEVGQLRKFVTPEIVHGPGARRLAGMYARNIGATCALVVSDPGVAAAGWLDEVVRSLEREGLATRTFTGVTPNPRTAEVAAGKEHLLEGHCDAIAGPGPTWRRP
jgi:alcohol dehydrogenase